MSQRSAALAQTRIIAEQRTATTAATVPKHPRASFAPSQRLSSVLHSLVWVSLACATVWFVDLPGIIASDTRISWLAINLSLMFLIAIVAVIGYLALVLPRTHVLGAEVADDYYAHAPHAIHAIIILSGCWYATACTGMWPALGWWTPPVLSMISMGMIMVVNLLPSCGGNQPLSAAEQAKRGM